MKVNVYIVNCHTLIRCVACGKGTYGKKDKFGQTEWIYDNKLGKTIKNVYFGKKKHPDYEMKYGCQA